MARDTRRGRTPAPSKPGTSRSTQKEEPKAGRVAATPTAQKTDRDSFRDRMSARREERTAQDKDTTRTTATRVTHETEEDKRRRQEEGPILNQSTGKEMKEEKEISTPFVPTYSVGAGAPPQEQLKLRSTMERDRADAKRKARRQGRR